MRLLVSWLRDFVDVPAPAAEIADRLGLRGFEVAAIEPFGDGDAVIDFEVTANRPDCLSVLGLAREIATLYDRPLTPPSPAPGAKVAVAAVPTGSSDRIAVAVEDDELCPRYAAAVADVTVGPSPDWLAARLRAAGVRPINNIVDVTNYVLIEMGHPLHAFDLATLAGSEIRVRRARRGEMLTTLDGVERKLDPEMLVIADRDRAQAVAGVMGGVASEVSSATRMVAFESAYFKPASVRLTSKRIGLKTEASARFERGADISIPVVAIERVIALMEQIGAGRPVGPVIDRYARVRQPLTLHLRRDRLNRLLGAVVSTSEVERILRGLGLTVTAGPDGWDVVAPTYRVDLLREVDLIEEVGRHFGFDNLPSTFPAATAPAPPADPRVPRDRSVRRALTAAGLSEAVTFGFIEAEATRAFAASGETIAVANPLSAKFDTLRPSLLPGLIDAVGHNRRHGRRDVRLFEIGARFTIAGEKRGVALAWTGAAISTHWSGGAREVDFFDIKGVVEQLCAAIGVAVRLEEAPAAFLVPGQAAVVVCADEPWKGALVGTIGQLTPHVADLRGLPRQDRVLVAELDLDTLWKARATGSDAVRPLARHPFVVRDLSIVVADTLPAAIISGTIQAAARDVPAPLSEMGFFDRYQGKGVPDGAASLSVRLTFQAPDRTLTDAEVQQSFDTILAALVREHGAVQR
ncbi:MAG: phenylalanine--tRNA ligase subunit beta [Vicinamibacterales bacterium]